MYLISSYLLIKVIFPEFCSIFKYFENLEHFIHNPGKPESITVTVPESRGHGINSSNESRAHFWFQCSGVGSNSLPFYTEFEESWNKENIFLVFVKFLLL
jgi:hypothetical protein